VDLAGSLRDGKNDEFSDIDITVTVNQDVNDRDFFFALPDLLRPIGGTVRGWGFHALPDQYVATFLFEDFPLFWGVDIARAGGAQQDGSDLVPIYRWEQIYKMWILAAKYIARGEAKFGDVHRRVARHVEVSVPPSTAAARLAELLSGIEARKIDRGDPYQSLHARYVELAASLTSA